MMLPFRSKIFEFTDNESPYIQIKQYIYIYIYIERERERERERKRERERIFYYQQQCSIS